MKMLKYEWISASSVVNVSSTVHSYGNNGHPPISSLEICFFQPIHDIHSVITIYTSKVGCKYCYKILNHTFDVCHFFEIMKSKKSLGFIKQIFQTMGKYGKIPSKCPVNKGCFKYKNITHGGQLLPNHLPTGHVKILLNFYTLKDKPVFSLFKANIENIIIRKKYKV